MEESFVFAAYVRVSDKRSTMPSYGRLGGRSCDVFCVMVSYGDLNLGQDGWGR